MSLSNPYVPRKKKHAEGRGIYDIAIERRNLKRDEALYSRAAKVIKLNEHRSSDLLTGIMIDIADRPFVPSSALVGLFKNGIEAEMQLARRSPDFNKSIFQEMDHWELRSSEELIDFLQEEIMQLFATVASRGQARDLEEQQVSEGSSLDISLAAMISKTFLLHPRDISEFIEQLGKELYSHIANYGSFSGSWGKMILRGSNLFLSLAGDEEPNYPPKVRARFIPTDL